MVRGSCPGFRLLLTGESRPKKQRGAGAGFNLASRSSEGFLDGSARKFTILIGMGVMGHGFLTVVEIRHKA